MRKNLEFLAELHRGGEIPELGILFVADEVITGFGRTGPMFACEAERISPDLMTVAKGLTAGYAPMGAVLISEEIYAGIAKKFPRQVARVLIREVAGPRTSEKRFLKAFRALPQQIATTFRAPEELEDMLAEI